MSIAASFCGNLGQDADLRYTNGGMAVLSFSVATTHYDKSAENNKATQWVRCSLFGKRGESMAPHLKKGSSVFVRGTLKLNVFTGRDGVEKTGLDVVVDDVEFAGGKGDGAQGTRGASPRSATAPNPSAGTAGPARGHGGGSGYGGEGRDAGGHVGAPPAGDDDSCPF